MADYEKDDDDINANSNTGSIAGGAKTSKRRKKHKRKSREVASKAPKLSTLPSQPSAVTPGFNLGGRHSQLQSGAFKKIIRKIQGAYNPGNLSTDPHWTFIIRSTKDEWIRFFPDSITFLIFGSRAQAPAAGVAQPDKNLLAREGDPPIFLDPSVQGTSFVKSIQVIINGVTVESNCFNNHLLQYVRMSRIFNDNPAPHFRYTSDVQFPTGAADDKRKAITPAMKLATAAFDFRTATKENPAARIPIFADGVFPFSVKNASVEAIDRDHEPSLYLPPEVNLEIKVILHHNKNAGIFATNVAESLGANYFAAAPANEPAATAIPKLSFQAAEIEYESAILTEKQHVITMNQFANKAKYATYDYDIVRSQTQTMAGRQSLTENNFQILPYCRLVYVLFLPNYALQFIEAQRKPLSGLTRFPLECTSMRVTFAGESNLVCENFERFGDQDEDHQSSKRIYATYLRDKHLIRHFQEIFPTDPTGRHSLKQALVFDLKPYMSAKTEILKIRCEFSGNTRSPENHQLLVLSVHPDGRATCRSAGAHAEWEWKFETRKFHLVNE